MRMRNSGKETGSRFAQLSDTSGLQSDHTGHGDTSSKGSRGVRRTSPSVCKESRNSRTFCQQAPERHRASSTATTSSDDLEIIGSPSLETKRLVRDLGQYVAGVKRKRAGRHRTSGDEESSEAATSASSSSSNVNPTPTLSQADRKNGQASTFKIVDIHSSSANSSDNDSSLPTSQSSPSLTFDDWEWGREEGRRSFRTFVASHGDIEEDSAPLVRAVKAYNLRPRQADKTYRETPSPVPETVQERRNRRKKQKHVTETSVSSALPHSIQRPPSTNSLQKEKPRHDCPCHNISICVRMLHAANEPFLATHVLNANRPPRMTPRLLSLLYPTHERLDDAELLGHRCRRR